ncbi:unnamed protein product, partial [Timema podura]|nr:unnamed protein product [Timema podura]
MSSLISPTTTPRKMHGATNVAAINTLLQDIRADCLRNERECRFDGFVVDGLEVIPLYDPPHLLKGIRNNMLKYNIHFVEDGVKKISKWSYVEQLFELDQQQPYRFRSCPKLSKFNVDKKYIKKMKVSGAAQVLSHHAATSMRQIAERPSVGRPYMNPEATDTADLLLFFDELFDSVNGVLLVSRDGKPLRTALTQNSPHLPFWDRAMTTLRSMEFREERTHSKVNNVMALHSVGFNCEEDDNIGALDTLSDFIVQGVIDSDPISLPELDTEQEEVITGEDMCVPAWIA